MIALSLADIAAVVGGRVDGDPQVVVTAPATLDSRAVEPGGLFVAIAGEHVDGHDFAQAAVDGGAAAVLASRAVGVPAVLVDDVQTALGALAHHVLERLRPSVHVVALTGSQGKTSVKDLLAHVLEGSGPTVATAGSFNNELGLPLTVLRADAGTRFLVLEMGARGIGHIATLCAIARPTLGLVLNVGSAHLGEFGSADNIAVAKGEIVEALDADGVAVLNADDPRVAAMAPRTSARVVTFGAAGDVALGPVRLDDAGEPHFTLTIDGRTADVHVPQIGAHHAPNAAAAAAVATALGVDLDDVAARLSTAGARSRGRLDRHVRADGVTILDDSYNANPESVRAGLDALAAVRAERRIAVLGEMLELGDDAERAHRDVGAHAVAAGIDHVLAVGPGAREIAHDLGERATVVPDVEAGVRFLRAWLRPGDVVLVKASRGARLERVTSALLDDERHTRPVPPTTPPTERT